MSPLFSETVIITALIFIHVGLITYVMNMFERVTNWCLGSTWGRRHILTTGLIGTSVHEIAHASICILFNMRIVSMSLWNPDPVSNGLGYVQYRYNPLSYWHQLGLFVCGIAPLLMGIVWMNLYWDHGLDYDLADPETLLSIPEQYFYLVSDTLSQNNGWLDWSLMVVAICVAMHAAPSSADLKGCLKGCIGLVITIIGVLLSISAFEAASTYISDNVISNVRDYFVNGMHLLANGAFLLMLTAGLGLPIALTKLGADRLLALIIAKRKGTESQG